MTISKDQQHRVDRVDRQIVSEIVIEDRSILAKNRWLGIYYFLNYLLKLLLDLKHLKHKKYLKHPLYYLFGDISGIKKSQIVACSMYVYMYVSKTNERDEGRKLQVRI